MKNRLTLLAVAVGSILPISAMAQQQPSPIYTKSGIELLPHVGIKQNYNNNVFKSSDNAKSSWNTEVNAGLGARGEVGANTFSGIVDVTQGHYDYNSLDYTNMKLGGEAALEFDARNRLNLQYLFSRDHDKLGTGYAEGTEQMHRYNRHSTEATYSFGAPGAFARWDVYAGLQDTKYQNHRDVTRQRDNKQLRAGTVFNYNIMPSTDLLVELGTERRRYDNNNYRDSDTVLAMVGATWQITGMTEGTFKVGVENKNFNKQLGNDNITAPRWEGALRWSPLSYSRFDLLTESKIKDAFDRRDNYIRATGLELTWTHDWADRFSTRVIGSYYHDDYDGSRNRLDKTAQMGVEGVYDLRRNFQLVGGYTYTDRESNVRIRKYDQDKVFLNLVATM